MKLRIAGMFIPFCFVMTSHTSAEEANDLTPALIFHASFDDVLDANLSAGTGLVYTAESLAREKVRQGNHRDDVKVMKNAGKFGDALYFASNSKRILFYRGDEIHLPENWSATFSFWLKLDPNKDLEPGYCDPFQITEKAWNNASLFVDFDKELPRDFRLGAFSDFERWNPSNIAWEKIPQNKRPLVTVKQPPFSSGAWTHVVFAIENVNPAGDSLGTATLYLNGEQQGALTQPMHYTWDQKKVALMIGINYIGYLDDLAVFGRALTPDEIVHVYHLPKGMGSVR